MKWPRAAAVVDRRDTGEHVEPVVHRHAFTRLETVALVQPTEIKTRAGRLQGIGGLPLAGMSKSEDAGGNRQAGNVPVAVAELVVEEAAEERLLTDRGHFVGSEIEDMKIALAHVPGAIDAVGLLVVSGLAVAVVSVNRGGLDGDRDEGRETREIGRASCRERGEDSGGAGSF